MKLQQLRALCVIADENMSMSRAARVLCTTQPAVSKQIRQLEDSLGLTLLLRSKSRILGFTEAGEDVLRAARTVMMATQDIQSMVGDHLRRTGGRLAIATTHTHARYTLSGILPEFSRRHPGVAVHLVQATPDDIPLLIVGGQVDIGICTTPHHVPSSLVGITCYVFEHVLVGPPGHPALAEEPVTLASIAASPLISYSEQHAIARRLTAALEEAGLPQNVVVRGTDVEVMKHYAALGLGLAVIPRNAYTPADRERLAARGVDHLLPPSMVYVLARRGAYWPRHLYEFVNLLSPVLTRTVVEQALRDGEPPGERL